MKTLMGSMKFWAITTTLICTLGACQGKDGKGSKGSKGSKKSGSSDDSAAWATVPVKVGDAVVARNSRTYQQLRVGKIVKKQGTKVTVQFKRKRHVEEIAAAQVYKVPQGRNTLRVKVDEVVLFTTNGETWREGVVVKVNDTLGRVRPSFGEIEPLVPDRTIKVSAETAEAYLKKAAGHKVFNATKKLKPPMPMGYKPKKGERVLGCVFLARSWEPGKGFSEDGKIIAWDSKKVANSRQARGTVRLIPVPTPADAPALKKGMYLLVKSNDPKRLTWKYAQVTSVTGKNAQVLTQDGTIYGIAPGEYVVLK